MADFGAVTQLGTSSGTVTPTRSSAAEAPVHHRFDIRIDTSGQVGAGSYSYSVDGGTYVTGSGTIPSALALTGGTTVAFANGVSNPSFVAGSIFSFEAAPGIPLSSLIATQSQDEIKARLLAGLNIAGFPVTDWYPGSAGRSIVEMEASALYDLTAGAIAEIARGGYLDYATGSWLRLLAAQKFNTHYTEATFTVQTLTLTNGAPSPYTVNAGDLIFESTQGNRYRNTTGGTLPARTGGIDGTLAISVKAESPGAKYNDATATITRMVTPLPAVTASNTAPDYSGVSSSGGSTGTISVARTVVGTPPDKHTYWIKILTSGQVGAATFAYAVDSTAANAYVTVGVIPVSFNVGGGSTITFANGAGNPSFIAGSLYTFSSPGSPVISQGRDEETDQSLRERSRAKWALLSEIPTNDTYVTWSKDASPDVAKVFVSPSNEIPGLVEVVIAGSGSNNPLAGGIVTTVANYIKAREGVLDKSNVQAAANVSIVATGTVAAPGVSLAAVKADAEARWAAYIDTVVLGGTVRVSELAQALMDAGAVDIKNLTLTGANARVVEDGVSPLVNLKLTTAQVATVGAGGLTSSLTWIAA